MDLKNFLKVKSLRSPGWSSCIWFGDVGFCVCVCVFVYTGVSAWALRSQLHWFLHTPEGVSLQSAEQELTCCSVRSHWCFTMWWSLILGYTDTCTYSTAVIHWGRSSEVLHSPGRIWQHFPVSFVFPCLLWVHLPVVSLRDREQFTKWWDWSCHFMRMKTKC